MKIHKQEATFQPVMIILESQEELQWLLACLNCPPRSALEQARQCGLELNIEDIVDKKQIDTKMFAAVNKVWKSY